MTKWLCQCMVLTIVLCVPLTACKLSVKNPAPKGNISYKGAVAGGVVGGVVGACYSCVSVGTGAGVGVIVGGVFGHQIYRALAPHHRMVRSYLHKVQIGEDNLVIVPTDDAFIAGSPRINPQYYPVLDQIARIIRNDRKVMVKVAGFTDNIGPPYRNLALSREQAQQIEKYLWASHIDTRLIYAVGYGQCYPISTNKSASGRAQNRRVEIAWRHITHKVKPCRCLCPCVG